MGKPKGPGRPPKAKRDRRDNTLRIRLTDQERRALDKCAAVQSLDTSTWARSVLVGLTVEKDANSV